MLGWRRPVTLVNARVWTPSGIAESVRFGTRVLAVDTPPAAKDVVIDLDGAFVLPGLVNAHDHLELNHYGRLKGQPCYQNATQWIADLRPRLQHDPVVREHMARPLSSRLFIGGLKNLLAGVTTVAHHNPRYREIGRAVPVRVVRRYGWAHSLALEREPVGAHGEPGGHVGKRCHATPADVPFLVHAGEGTDQQARDELMTLERLGCLRPNTVLIHGVSITPTYWTQMLDRGASLVWCPASNEFLFGQTAPVHSLLERSPRAVERVCLASDSRLTGARDLLEELRSAAITGIPPDTLLGMVSWASARILKLSDAGRIEPRRPADMIVIPATAPDAAAALLMQSRRDLQLVLVNGRPLVASPSLEAVFGARRRTARRLIVDGVERLADARLVREIDRCPIREPGLEL